MNNTELFEGWRRYLDSEEEKKTVNERMDYTMPPVAAAQGMAQRRRPRGSKDEIADWIQAALDVIGLVPGVGEPFDATNAAISVIRNKPLNALLSAISVIPIYGDIIGKGTKLLLWGIRTGKTMQLGAKTYTIGNLGALLKKNLDKTDETEIRVMADEVDNQTKQPKGTTWALYLEKVKRPINDAAAGKIGA